MTEIHINEAGVRTQSQTIEARTSEAEESISSYTSQTYMHQSFLDGIAVSGADRLNHDVKRAVEASCETVHNMRKFMEKAAQDTVSLDLELSTGFNR